MSYKNKTYVIFDGDNDMSHYQMMRAWKANDNIDFDFFDAHDLNDARDSSTEESIKAQLRERMKNAKQVVVLQGDNTKYLKKFVAWEIKLARKKDIPILVVNLNGERGYDEDLCHPALKDGYYTMHLSYGSKILKYALDEFPSSYSSSRDRKTKGHYKYKDAVYEDLGY